MWLSLCKLRWEVSHATNPIAILGTQTGGLMLVSIIQIYPLKAPVGSGCHQILGWDGNKWNRYTRTGKTWEYALPAGKVHKHQKLIFWFQTLYTYVSHILYSVRCSNQCLQYRFQIWDLQIRVFSITKVPNLGVPNFKSQIWDWGKPHPNMQN